MMKFISTTPYRCLYLLQLPGAVLGGGLAEIEFCTFQTLKKPVKILWLCDFIQPSPPAKQTLTNLVVRESLLSQPPIGSRPCPSATDSPVH